MAPPLTFSCERINIQTGQILNTYAMLSVGSWIFNLLYIAVVIPMRSNSDTSIGYDLLTTKMQEQNFEQFLLTSFERVQMHSFVLKCGVYKRMIELTNTFVESSAFLL